MSTPPSASPPAPVDIFRTLANALFAADFMEWERIPGPDGAPPGAEVDAIQGRTDAELVDMIDGGVYTLDTPTNERKSYNFTPTDVKNWIAVVTKYRHPKTGNARFDGITTCLRTGTMVRLTNEHAAHVYGIGVEALESAEADCKKPLGDA